MTRKRKLWPDHGKENSLDRPRAVTSGILWETRLTLDGQLCLDVPEAAHPDEDRPGQLAISDAPEPQASE